jgi:hypothetical protein
MLKWSEAATRVVRRLLAGAKGIDDLPEGWAIEVEKGGLTSTFQLVNEAGREEGHVRIRWLSDCHAWEVMNSYARGGWGPFLYDIAMEYVGDDGLTPDRGETSPDAQNVWAHYMRRSDVYKFDLTADPDAVDCFFYSESDPKFDFLDFRYVKKTRTIIPGLRALGKWRG